jgi:hypothetical protein
MTARTYTLVGQDRRKSAGRPRVQATAQALGVFATALAAFASAPLQPPPSAL